MSIQRVWSLIVVGLSSSLLGGCGVEVGEEGDEPLQAAQAALSESCGMGALDDEIKRRGKSADDPNSTLQSPTIYGSSSCPKGWRVQVPTATPSSRAQNTLQWADPWARNRVQCEGGSLSLDVYVPIVGQVVRVNSESVPLVWDEASQRCLYGRIDVRQDDPGTSGGHPDWFSEVYVQRSDSTWRRISQRRIPLLGSALTARPLRFVLSATTPRGTTQPVRFSSFER